MAAAKKQTGAVMDVLIWRDKITGDIVMDHMGLPIVAPTSQQEHMVAHSGMYRVVKTAKLQLSVYENKRLRNLPSLARK